MLHGQSPGADKSSEPVGVWSKEATSLRYPWETRKLEITAPDGRKIALIDGVRLHVVIDGRPLPGTVHEGVGTLAELAWSPSSDAFFITESDGGSIGRWDTRVYLIKDGKVRGIHLTQEVVREFKKQYSCVEPEEPNIGAVQWMGSDMLLLAAEVPPHSSCPEMGKIRGYVVSVPKGRILQRLGEEELRARWGRYLGARFAK
jgi:hypothetical protein